MRGGNKQRVAQPVSMLHYDPLAPPVPADHRLPLHWRPRPELTSDDIDLSPEGPRFWTREALRLVVERVLGRRHFIVVSNREPYVHRLEGEDVICERPVSGLVTALE